ncbi:MAG: rhomboid family intramembrane serine protease [Microbacteriaceae bacterium]|nr:rhomboid family intramembrane serine protease [Microbacteriaceae bacterium]
MTTSPPFGTDAAGDAGNACYRHPDRQSFILCQRCGRTICPQCSTEAAVGFHCPECLRESRAAAPQRPLLARSARRLRSPDAPVVTYTLIALCVLVFLIQSVPGGERVYSALAYYPPLTLSEPWRVMTALFLHQGIFHIGFNMLALFLFGRVLEPLLGRWRFAALYLLSGFGGSLAVLLLSPTVAVVGASGAIFGLFSALFVVQRSMGGNSRQFLVLIAINFALAFISPGISWQAHVGGLVVGAVVAAIFQRTRQRTRQLAQKLLLGLLTVALVVGTSTYASAMFGG